MTRFFTSPLDPTPNPSSRPYGRETVGIVDTEQGGIIAYAHESTAPEIVRALTAAAKLAVSETSPHERDSEPDQPITVGDRVTALASVWKDSVGEVTHIYEGSQAPLYVQFRAETGEPVGAGRFMFSEVARVTEPEPEQPPVRVTMMLHETVRKHSVVTADVPAGLAEDGFRRSTGEPKKLLAEWIVQNGEESDIEYDGVDDPEYAWDLLT